MWCRICGNENPDEFVYCIQCGQRMDAAPPDPYGQRQPQQPLHPQPASPRDAYPAEPRPRPDWPPEPPAHPPRREPDSPPLREPRAAPSFWLSITDASGHHTRVDLDGGIVTIGRSSRNTVVIDDSKVSRDHAKIYRSGQGFVVEDLGSRNGTKVDEAAIVGPHALRVGATIRIGDSTLKLESVVAAQPVHPVHDAPTPHPDIPAPRPSARQPAEVPVLFSVSWAPLQCPGCQGINTLRPILYGPAASSPAARQAAERGEAFLGGPGVGPTGPNAQCTSCDQQVRIMPASPS
ncbi:MAG: FHA domain-containing protein [Chloroflexota bacterium]